MIGIDILLIVFVLISVRFEKGAYIAILIRTSLTEFILDKVIKVLTWLTFENSTILFEKYPR